MSDEDTRSSDFSEDEIEEDDEEEEQLDVGETEADELRLLNEENELSVEELRRRYYGEADIEVESSSSVEVASSSKELDEKPKGYFTEEALAEEDEDEDYVPKAEYWRKDVRVGPTYQVELPLPEARTLNNPDEYVEPIKAIPLWSPAGLSKSELEEFLSKVSACLHELEDSEVDTTPQANRTPKYDGVCDDEDALFALYRDNYDVDGTLKKVPFQSANGPRLTGPPQWKPMTSEDVDRFEEAFKEFGKNFYKIRVNKMSDRTVGELVNFYYSWKKTERHDMYKAKIRALGLVEGSSKTLDPMDLLADQQLNEVNGGLQAAPKESATSVHKHWLSVPSEPPQLSEK